MVDAAQILNRAVGQVASEVARPVQAAAVDSGEGVGDKPFRGEVGPVQVAAGQPRAAEIDLAGNALRHGLQEWVEQIGLRVVDGPSDGGDAVDGSTGERGIGRVLRRTIEVVNVLNPLQPVQLSDELLRERLACQVDGPHRPRDAVEAE